jgi:2-aminoadipate transaminase
MKTTWERRFAHRIQYMKASTIRKLLQFTTMPDVISFAGGLPAPKIFPAEKFNEAFTRVLKEKAAIALQYGSTDGYLPLREWIAVNNPTGLKVSPENIIITNGAQQGLDLLGRAFINQGDHILVESPTYLGALQAWNGYGAEYIPTKMDQDGIIPEAFEQSIRCGAKFAYLQPNFQNPTGESISLERRKEIIRIADHYGIPLVEDDPYGKLYYDEKPADSLMKIDSEFRNCPGVYCGDVIYLGTFSKVLAPGMRIAYMIAPTEVIQKVNLCKQGADLHTPTFNQVAIYETIKDGFIEEHVKVIRAEYKHRRDIMLEALDEFMPEGIRWTHPNGGLFLWAFFPKHVDTTKLLEYAIQEKVAFVPGEQFFTDEKRVTYMMRLNFSNAEPSLIVEGVHRLVRAYKAYLKECC